MTPAPTPDLAPQLVVQPVPKELRAGERIAFLRDGDLWLVRPDGSSLARVSTSANVSAIFGWSWDNSRLLLGVTTRHIRPCDYPSLVDLWVLSTDGAFAQQVTTGQTVTSASWAPQGPTIAYATKGEELITLNLDTAEAQRMQGVIWGYSAPVWSPDGSRLAFEIPFSEECVPWEICPLDIAVWDIAAGTVSRLTYAEIDDPFITLGSRSPVWSVDGSTILFQSGRGEKDDLQLWYKMNYDGSNVQHLDTPPLPLATDVRRSPVADQVVINVFGEIWLVDLTGHARKIAESPDLCWVSFSWSPDGTQLALVEVGGNLVRIDLHDLAVETITGIGSSPAWTR